MHMSIVIIYMFNVTKTNLPCFTQDLFETLVVRNVYVSAVNQNKLRACLAHIL